MSYEELNSLRRFRIANLCCHASGADNVGEYDVVDAITEKALYLQLLHPGNGLGRFSLGIGRGVLEEFLGDRRQVEVVDVYVWSIHQIFQAYLWASLAGLV